MITLKLKNGILSMVRNQINASNSINYYKIKVEILDEEWKDLETHISFFQNIDGAVYETKLPEDNIVKVPYELLENELPYYVGAFGLGENIRAVTNNVKIPVVQGAYKPQMVSFDNDRQVEIVAPDGRIIALQGTYEGTPVTVSSNEDVNIEELLEENKLPLSVNVDIPTYEGEKEDL